MWFGILRSGIDEALLLAGSSSPSRDKVRSDVEIRSFDRSIASSSSDCGQRHDGFQGLAQSIMHLSRSVSLTL